MDQLDEELDNPDRLNRYMPVRTIGQGVFQNIHTFLRRSWMCTAVFRHFWQSNTGEMCGQQATVRCQNDSAEGTVNTRFGQLPEGSVPSKQLIDHWVSPSQIKILSQLQHPCIVRYIESFVDDNVLYIIQEYADGGDLLQVCMVQVVCV